MPIETTFQKRAIANLRSGRDGFFPLASWTAHADDGDWELATRLVVQPPA